MIKHLPPPPLEQHDPTPRCQQCGHAIHYGMRCTANGNCYPPIGEDHSCHCDTTPVEVERIIQEVRRRFGIELTSLGGLTSKTNHIRKFREDVDDMRRESWKDRPDLLEQFGLEVTK